MSQTEVMDPCLEKWGERSETEGKKLCTECKTAKTPLWRIGPHGPKSLCNACGIKFRKKKGGGGGTLTVSNKESSNKKKENPSPASAAVDCSGKKGNDGNMTSVKRRKNGNLGSKLKVGLMCLGREVVLLKRPRSPMKRRRSCKKLGEVEQAALLLMAMSCDSVYA